ncbi:hypothetical protein GCM10022295_91210 [Streptomyces osmaniensis]|uniref:Uncharacterized protein n=1 Tax=Streptomyces osmaniensis TaxID=593134 RepID=A0ABP6Z4K6_9ACTN
MPKDRRLQEDMKILKSAAVDSIHQRNAVGRFDDCGDLGQAIALPVPRHRATVRLRQSLADGAGTLNLRTP